MSLADKISKRTFPTTTITICLDAELASERDAAIRELAAAKKKPNDGRLAAKSPVAGLQQKVDEIESRMRDSLVKIRMTGLPFADYNKIMRAHPPRQGRQEAYNVETFFPDVAYKSGELIEGDTATPLPQVPRKEWDELVALLTDKEFDTLVEGVLAVNRTLQEVGFLARGSATTPASSETSD